MKKIMIILSVLTVILSLAACGRSANDPSISAEEALDIALNEAGVTRDSISDLDTGLEEEDGRLVYDIDFKVGTAEYSYDVNAKNGDIVSRGD